MKPEKPLKRHDALVPLSREHHQGLLLCWKIKQGLAKSIDPTRIKQYADWFFREHLVPHFAEEENVLFPILGNNHALVTRAVAEHRELEMLFADHSNVEQSLRTISEKLDKHIRFEERELFEFIQRAATEEQLQALAKHDAPQPFCDNESDPFWK
jgi:iron-sulfur cluster repair protein YtfE (RIC family)